MNSSNLKTKIGKTRLSVSENWLSTENAEDNGGSKTKFYKSSFTHVREVFTTEIGITPNK